MYIRFVCAQRHPTLDAELGMFSAREEMDLSRLPRSLQRAQEEAFYWFSKRGPGLRYPRLTGKLRTRDVRKSLFWFKEDAYFHWGRDKGSVVRRARELAQVMTDCGIEIREIQSRDPGRIVWQDLKQILAMADGGRVPKAFR